MRFQPDYYQEQSVFALNHRSDRSDKTCQFWVRTHLPLKVTNWSKIVMASALSPIPPPLPRAPPTRAPCATGSHLRHHRSHPAHREYPARHHCPREEEGSPPMAAKGGEEGIPLAPPRTLYNSTSLDSGSGICRMPPHPCILCAALSQICRHLPRRWRVRAPATTGWSRCFLRQVAPPPAASTSSPKLS
jgi:hypothetical protein